MIRGRGESPGFGETMHYIATALAQSLGVLFLALLGVRMGKKLNQEPHPWLHLGYATLFLLCAMIAATNWLPHLQLISPFGHLVANRTEFAIMALTCPMLMTALIDHLDHRRKKIMVGTFTGMFTVIFSVFPFLIPAIAYAEQSQYETYLDEDGVCIQSTGFNCGPAAAVTALRRLGIPAQESELALAAFTTNFRGTPMDSLSSAIYTEYGIMNHLTYETTLDEMKDKVPFIAVIKFDQTSDHYVTVLSITEGKIEVADPLTGIRFSSPEVFNRKWRKAALILAPAPI